MSTSILAQILDAVVTRLGTLSLSGSPTITTQKLPWNLTQVEPGVFVSPVRETIDVASNIRDDVYYGVQITAFQASNKNLTSDLDRLLLWRERISKAFRQRALDGMPTQVISVAVEPGPVIDVGAWKDNFDATSLVLRCRSRETRG